MLVIILIIIIIIVIIIMHSELSKRVVPCLFGLNRSPKLKFLRGVNNTF